MEILSDSISKSFGVIHSTAAPPYMIGAGNVDRVCGRCGTTLVSGYDADVLKFGTAAIHCGNCGTTNNLGQITKLHAPRMLKDIKPKIPNRPVLAIHNPTGIGDPTFSLRSKMQDKLTSEWGQLHAEVPGILYQYTSFFGLLGILSTHSIWLTNIEFMNDSSEMRYGQNLISEYVDEKKQTVSDLCKEVLIGDIVGHMGGTMAACFCTNNDLLSQWRAYGQGGSGYNIGFDASQLCTNPKVQLRKVIYQPNTQITLIRNVIDSVCETFEGVINAKAWTEKEVRELVITYQQTLLSHLREFVVTFKHKAFEEEDEWRLFYRMEYETELRKLRFRQFNGVPVPYIELEASDITKGMPILPIVKITHGPVLLPELTKDSCSLIMRKHEYSHAEIEGSTTPLRV